MEMKLVKMRGGLSLALVAAVALVLVASVAAKDPVELVPAEPFLCNGSIELHEHRWKTVTLSYKPQVLRHCFRIPYKDSQGGVLRVWTQTLPGSNSQASSLCTKVLTPTGGPAVCGTDQVQNNKNVSVGWLVCQPAAQPGGVNTVWVMVGCNGVTLSGACPGGDFNIEYRVRYDFLDGEDDTVQSCLTDVDYYGGFQLWVWILLGACLLVFLLIVVALAVFLVWRTKKSKPQYSVYDEDIDDYLGEDDKVTIGDDAAAKSFPPPVVGPNADKNSETRPILSEKRDEYEDIS